MALVHGTNGQPISDGQGGFVDDGTLAPAAYDARTALFFAAEIDTYRPGDPAGTLTPIRVSDLGYRTRSTDAAGVVTYPGLLDTVFEINRKVSLDPTQVSSRSDGNVRITNLGQAYDAFLRPRNLNGRRIRMFVGQKVYDPARGIYLDPPYAALQPFFAGSVGQVLLAEDVLTVPVADTSYWTQRPAQSKVYGGTGKYDGGAALAGKTVPMTRGGTAANPVLQVPLVQVDTVNQVWQWTDGPGTVVNLYEAGYAVFAYAGDVADLYATPAPAPGTYRTCNALGVLQLGSAPVGTITADVTGAFTTAGVLGTAAAVASALLIETLGVPADLVNAAAFAQVDGWFPYVAGFFLADQTQGLTLVQNLLASVGARLVTTRSGQLRPFVIAPNLFGAPPVAALTMANAVSVDPVSLPTTLDPPPYRWQVAYAHCWQTQTTGLGGRVTQDQKQFLAAADRYAVWTDPGVQAAWLRPNDPTPITSYLLAQADAARVAEAAGDLWRDRPGYYNVVVPLDVAAGLDIGSVVSVTWPLAELTSGVLGQIVGEQVRSYDNQTTFQVLFQRSIGPFSPTDFGGGFSGGTP